ncbi:MAG: hypothetical protein H7222_09335 [Methylotenera sp.]|nr:hypothetical protein [Oligoflexia bacterium]
MDYSKAPENTEAVLKLISRSLTGRTLLEKFLPLFTSKRVRIEGYPSHVVRQLREVLDEGQPIGACFVQDGSTGVIYLDFASPVGILAPFLVHEMVHCLDNKLWKVARKSVVSGQSVRRAQYNSELEAFEKQHNFLCEMKERFPDYRLFLEKHFPKAKMLHEKLSQMDISEMYGDLSGIKSA